MLSTIITFLEQSIELFKKNYNIFISLSIVSGLIAFFHQTFQNYVNIQDDTFHKIILGLISLTFLVIGLIYYSSRFYISLFLLINDKINSRATSLSKVFDESEALFWNYFKTTLKLVLLVIIPMILFMLVLIPEINLFVKVILAVISILSILYIVLNYGLAINVSILEPEETNYFTKSKALFETNRKMVALLFLFVIGISAIVGFIPSLFLDKVYVFNIIDRNNFLATILGVVVSPISTGLIVYTYWHLNNAVDLNSNSQEENDIDGSEV